MSEDATRRTTRVTPRALRLARFDEIDVTIEKLVQGGDGLARFEGLPILVPLSAPGDRARVRVSERKPQYARADIVELLQPGPLRTTPRCRHFGTCGGCTLQHLRDEDQGRLKVDAAVETLSRLGGIDLREPPRLFEGPAYAYRLRAQLHTSESEGTTDVGYFAGQSHDVVRVDECPVLVPSLEKAVLALHSVPGPLPRRIDLLAAASDEDAAVSYAPRPSDEPSSNEVTVEVAARQLTLDARCFFQANVHLLTVLVEEVVGETSGGSALELYSGVGLFTVFLAERYTKVTAIESDRVAVRYARRNLRRNGSAGAVAHCASAEHWLETREAGDFDRIVVDPPRAGLSKAVIAHLLTLRTPSLTYVSCQAPTLARDLKLLAAAYEVVSVSAFDLFPQTGHLELVCQLRLRDDETS